MKYLYMRLPELLAERNISRTRLCKDLDLQRTNVNRYYRNEYQRIDRDLVVKLCEYLHCDVSDLFEIREQDEGKEN